MKKVCIISSSFRGHSSTRTLCEVVANEAKLSNYDVTTIDISKLNIHFCIGCLACQKTGKCVINDDMPKVINTIKNSDILVFATPIYFYSLSGQLKTFLDRLNPLYGSDYRFSDIYFIATAADDDIHAMDKSIDALNGWICCFDKASLKEVVKGLNVNYPSDITDELINKTKEIVKHFN